MSLLPDQIARIQGRLPGWEDDWGRLCVILLGEDGESGALIQAVNALPITWPSEEVSAETDRGVPREGTERDDFICKVIADYHRRAVRGTLLVSYDPKLGDVVSFLTSPHLLYVEAIKFLEKLAVRQLPSFDDAEFDPKNDLKARPHQDEAFWKLISEVQQVLERMILDGIKRVSRITEQAALQLYPRLDWSRPAMKPLREHLLHVVRPTTTDTDPLSALSQAHQMADRSFRNRLERLSAKIHNKGKGVSIRRREHLERIYGDLCFQRIFLPLGAGRLAKLLGITAANAAKLRERYRAQLPCLLPRLGTYYEALREYRSAASREHRL